MTKKQPKRSFNEVLAELGTQRFDVASATGRTGAMRVSKYGVAAEIADGQGGPVMLVQKAGWVLNGEIGRLVDRGFQKFLKTSKLEIPATADKLRAIHDFQQELDLATGETVLYNEAMGTTSDVYLYDRVAGRADAAKH
jgi:hypothetical protein